MKKLLHLVPLLWLMACSPKAQPINYGTDKCEYCRMTIVDQQHGAELVTHKGRVHKFDAIECMVNFLNQNSDKEIAIYLVNDYLTPGTLINATESSYLISPNIPSPMGANLSAFKNRDNAMAIQAQHKGTIYSWEKILTHINPHK